jgi:hypothetical protein
MMRRHELDPVSLVFGFAFTAAGALFLAGRLDQAVRLRWLWPVLLLALGLGILLDLSVRRPKAPAEPPAALDESEEPMGAEPVQAERVQPEQSEVEPVSPEPPEAEAARTAELEPEGLSPEAPPPGGPPPDRDA